jgi:signal transduction histidine kinase
MDVEAWVRRVAALETRVPVRVERGPSMTIHADSDQLDQLLINIVRNAADAALEQRERDMADGYAIDGASAVCVTWSHRDDRLVVAVDDTGPGLPPRANLFVPFFTTKATGSGIGLVLCRQIAEAHGGSIVLEDRAQGRGCVARLTLPISA